MKFTFQFFIRVLLLKCFSLISIFFGSNNYFLNNVIINKLFLAVKNETAAEVKNDHSCLLLGYVLQTLVDILNIFALLGVKLDTDGSNIKTSSFGFHVS